LFKTDCLKLKMESTGLVQGGSGETDAGSESCNVGTQGGFPAALTGAFHTSIVSLNNLFIFEHWSDA
jgi:hypothetical protein